MKISRTKHTDSCTNRFDEIALKNKLINVEKKFRRKQLAVDVLKDRLLELRKTVQERLKDRVLHCEVCLRPVAENMLLQHICFENIASIPCAYCNESFSSTKKLLDHLEFVHKDEPYIKECQACHKIFHMALLYDFHQKIFHFKQPETIIKPQIPVECTSQTSRKVVVNWPKGK